MIRDEQIKDAVEKIVNEYHPEAVYLFGSFAWGIPTEESDLDLLIIVNHSPEKPYKRPYRGFNALKGLKIPKDLIVSTRQEFDELSGDKTGLFYKIKKQGKKLYEAS